jgi:hypothetical protein
LHPMILNALDDEQRRRLAAGVLPKREVHDAVRALVARITGLSVRYESRWGNTQSDTLPRGGLDKLLTACGKLSPHGDVSIRWCDTTGDCGEAKIDWSASIETSIILDLDRDDTNEEV